MKMRAALGYSAKPMAIGLGILFFSTAPLRFTPIASTVTPVDMLFFFLAGALTFPRRTDILMQCGVSREKQYTVLWGLSLFAVAAGVLDAVLQGLGSVGYNASYEIGVTNAVTYFRTWYTVSESILLYSLVSVLRNIAALFAGNLTGILAYRFLRTNSRSRIILPCVLAGFVLLSINAIPYVLYTNLGHTESPFIAEQFMDSPLRWTLYFWSKIFLLPLSEYGDSVLFAVAVPLFYTVILTSLCCILLRSLPVRRGSNA